MKLAASLEDLTLGAYLGAVENVQTPQLRLPIGQIAANEAQHVSALAVARRAARDRPRLRAVPPDRRRLRRPRHLRELSDGEAALHGERGGGGARHQPRHAAPLGQGRAASRSSATRATGASSRRPRSTGCAATAAGTHLSARNRFKAIVTDVKVEGLMAQVEMVVTEPVRLVAVVTRDAVEELGLKNGMAATAVVKSTSVMVQL